mgnify:CR=1 FL=1
MTKPSSREREPDSSSRSSEGTPTGTPASEDAHGRNPDSEPTLVDQMKITTQLPCVNLQYGNGELRRHAADRGDDHATAHPRQSREHEEDRLLRRGLRQAARERPQDQRATRSAKLALEQENYEVEAAACRPTSSRSPTTRACVVIAGAGAAAHRAPRSRALDGLPEARRPASWSSSGRAAAATKPARVPRRWGVKLGERHRPRPRGPALRGSRLGVVAAREGVRHAPDHAGASSDLHGLSGRRARVDPDADGQEGIQATTLVKTSELVSWAEVNVDGRARQGRRALDDADKKGPLSIAVAVTANLKRHGHHAAACPRARSRPRRRGSSSSARRASPTTSTCAVAD